jgi:hypothetical protein
MPIIDWVFVPEKPKPVLRRPFIPSWLVRRGTIVLFRDYYWQCLMDGDTGRRDWYICAPREVEMRVNEAKKKQDDQRALEQAQARHAKASKEAGW